MGKEDIKAGRKQKKQIIAFPLTDARLIDGNLDFVGSNPSYVILLAS